MVDALRIRRFKDRARAARRRLFTVGVVAALATISLIGSSAQAATPAATVGTCNGTSYSSTEALLACLIAISRSPDFKPKDMQLAAPGGVIAATINETPNPVAPSTPTRDLREINRWKPNPQAWIDAKSRVSAGSGLTTADIEATGRWNPKLSRGVKLAGGAVSLLQGDTLMTWGVRDGVLYPYLESGLGVTDAREQVAGTWCMRFGNVVTDWFGGIVGADCASYRQSQEYHDGVRAAAKAIIGTQTCWSGGCFTIVDMYNDRDKSTALPQNSAAYCLIGATPRPSRTDARVVGNDGAAKWITSGAGGYSCQVGTRFGFQDASTSGRITLTGLRVRDDNGSIVEVHPTGGARHFGTRVRCEGGGQRYAASTGFTSAPGELLAAPAPVPLDNCKPVGVDVGWQNGDATANPWASDDRLQVGTAEFPQEVLDWQTQFPDCWDGSCLLTLKKTTSATTEIDCFDNPAECLDWYPQWQQDNTKYRCEYAGQTRPMSDCLVYTRVFDREKVQQGNGYSDPKTGQAGQGTSTTTNPGAAVVAMQAPAADPSKSRVCWPSGWAAFNPFEWVFMPVKCALEWAFVPRAEKLAQVQTALKLAAVNSKPGELISVVEAWGAVVPEGGTGCLGPEVRFVFRGQTHYVGHPFQACTGAMAGVADMTRIALSIIFVLLGIGAITRYLGRVFGFTGLGGGSE